MLFLAILLPTFFTKPLPSSPDFFSIANKSRPAKFVLVITVI